MTPVDFQEMARRENVPRDRRREVNAVLLYDFAQKLFARFRRDEGQTMAEYAVVLAVVTLLVIGAITLLSTNIGSEISKIANILTK
jgi:Flp pilus assembly pilin Flp